MEAFALFYNAKVLNKKAACLMTVVDSQFISKQATPEEREQGLTKMIKIALESWNIIICDLGTFLFSLSRLRDFGTVLKSLLYNLITITFFSLQFYRIWEKQPYLF